MADDLPPASDFQTRHDLTRHRAPERISDMPKVLNMMLLSASMFHTEYANQHNLSAFAVSGSWGITDEDPATIWLRTEVILGARVDGSASVNSLFSQKGLTVISNG